MGDSQKMVSGEETPPYKSVFLRTNPYLSSPAPRELIVRIGTDWYGVPRKTTLRYEICGFFFYSLEKSGFGATLYIMKQAELAPNKNNFKDGNV